eukprot:365490-Chlamydomonas_euryale.AAC.17
MVLEEGRLFAAACAADPLMGQTWPRAAAWEPPKGWPQSAPARVDARTHACINGIYFVANRNLYLGKFWAHVKDNASCMVMHVRAFMHAFVTP